MRQHLSKFRSFLSNREGSIPIIFAISALTLIGTGGLAIDFARGAQTKSQLMAAADSAALAAARTIGTAAEREAVAKKVFDANMKIVAGVQNVVMTPSNVLKDGRNYGFRVGVSGEVKTMLSGVLGFTEIGVSGLAEAIGEVSTPTEVALVLDTTGSMAGWKMSTLKDAATKLIDELDKLSNGGDKISYGVVPFAQYVNVGMSNRKKSWMDVPADWKETVTPACYDEPEGGWVDCVSTPKSGTCYNDGVPYTCTWTDWSCKPAGPMKKVCPGSYTVDHKWYGCAGSRNYPLNTRDESYLNRIPGILDVTCGTEMLELTTNAKKAKDHITSLTPEGETYTPSGLIWGWRMLSPDEPLAAKKKTKTEDVRKFMIFMTDGLNTRSPSYPANDGWDGGLSNNLAKEICGNIANDKANMITVFSVAFDVSDATTKSILQKCATDTGGQFFDAKSSADFLSAFSKIGQNIAELRLTK